MSSVNRTPTRQRTPTINTLQSAVNHSVSCTVPAAVFKLVHITLPTRITNYRRPAVRHTRQDTYPTWIDDLLVLCEVDVYAEPFAFQRVRGEIADVGDGGDAAVVGRVELGEVLTNTAAQCEF